MKKPRKRVTLRDAIAEIRKLDRTLSLVSGQMTALEMRLFFVEEQLRTFINAAETSRKQEQK